MKHAFSFENLNSLPVIGILRGFSREQSSHIVSASLRGGLKNLEITMNTPGAVHQIKDAVAVAGTTMNIGAGTVLTLKQLDEALAAGASFIVTPALIPAVISECIKIKVPVFPGAFTPTEIFQAWESGASMVKIFPAETLGPGYLRALKGPFPDIKLLPTGGVDLKTLGEFLKAGASGFGVGNPLFNREKVAAQEWDWVENQCRAFATAYSILKSDSAP